MSFLSCLSHNLLKDFHVISILGSALQDVVRIGVCFAYILGKGFFFFNIELKFELLSEECCVEMPGILRCVCAP